ncbi:zinc-dependent alcohol dehydrogenase [Phyllobacterium endophyticum]|uniref:zinc-dependent alcohol dehydrogenase n=1 Tax=Phyllobacterium endophyticum TaxID=1149773 RepID=UPI0011CCDC5A|nr:alcohol dehydrogenase catalytic domain-containing protein [Phyllobacterium endophyticum]TXR49491.1 alcohol dehydrogenase catalytic domain-containing protein [Phyllobacterium endophyticum]
MQAVRLYAAGDIRFEEIAAPGKPQQGWVRIRTIAAGICGSDLHNYRTGQWISRTPSTAGHELTGEVLELGDGVEGFAKGDHVVADSRFWCGECRSCHAGRRHLCSKLGFVGEICDGGFAEEIVLPARLVHKVDETIDPSIAAMAEPLAVALHAVKRLSLQPGSPVLVTGCGPIGGLIAMLLARGHDGLVLVTDRNAERAELVARVTGARIVKLDTACIEAATGGAPLLGAVEATGNAAVLAQLLDLVASGGTIALVGIFHKTMDIDPNLLVEREISLVGCHAFCDELPAAIKLLHEYADDLRQLIDSEIALRDVPAAYDRLITGQSKGLKTIIRMGGLPQ